MPFVPNSFTDGAAGGTPITAATLNNLEQGIVQADITNSSSAASISANARFAKYRAADLEVNERFANYATGSLTNTLTGLSYTPYGFSNNPVNVPRIESGTLTYDVTATQGGYASVQLADSVTRFGGSFFFDSATSNVGVAAMAIMESEIGGSVTGGFGVPRSPAHLQINPTSWSYQVFLTTGAAPTSLGGANWATPLAADGATLHTAEVILDRVQGTAYISLPDGNTVTITDPSIKLAARWIFWEPYRNATTENRAHFVESWSSSQSPAELVALKRAMRAQAGSTWFAETATGTDMVISGTTTDVPGAVLSYLTPANGKVLVTLSAQITSAALGDVFFAVKYLGGGNIVFRAVKGTGYYSVTIPLTLTGPVGYMRQISFGVLQGGGTNSLILSGSYTASIKVQHYQS